MNELELEAQMEGTPFAIAISDADRAAAVRLLGYDPTDHAMHERIANLTGSGQCQHILTGDGRDLDQIIARGEFINGEAIWRKMPYRHHQFTYVATTSGPTCVCGNYDNNPIHLHCWQYPMACDDCGRSDGTHNPNVEH